MLFPSSSTIEVGVDEAGRGPLAFEVVAAAVVMPSSFSETDAVVYEIRDSKKLSKAKREKLAEYIENTAVAYGIGIASVAEIDKHNILNATYMAMHRALDAAHKHIKFQHIQVDGDRFKPYMNKDVVTPVRTFETVETVETVETGQLAQNDDWIPFSVHIKGDDTHLNIAAASILAKVAHDALVHDYLLQNPDWKDMYGFHTNMGYGTAKHIEGIKKHGVTPYHRLSFSLGDSRKKKK